MSIAGGGDIGTRVIAHSVMNRGEKIVFLFLKFEEFNFRLNVIPLLDYVPQHRGLWTVTAWLDTEPPYER
jgi:hypothetical protein